MQPDGKNVLMLGPGFHEIGEHWHSSNLQFGLFRLAAWLKSTGHNVSFVDAALPPVLQQETHGRLKDRYPGAPIVREVECGNGETEMRMSKYLRYYGRSMHEVREDILKQPTPDEIWVGSGLTYHWETSWELAQLAREMFPGVRVRMGGIYPTLCPEHAKKSGAEIWEGSVKEAEEFWPDYSVAPYLTNSRTIKLNEGCTVAKACSFCAVMTLEKKFTFRGAQSFEEYVEQEIRKGVRVFKIWASQLLQPPQSFAETMDRLYMLQVKHGIRLRLYASEGIQPSLFTPDMAKRMVRAGFTHLTVPMESIDPEVLKAYNKPSNISDYHRAVQLGKEAGFSWIGAFIMTGTPQQTLDELVHAIVDCWYRRIVPVIMKYTIIPGTEDWANPKYQWIHKGKKLEDLHGSFWPAARPDLTCLELEEASFIAKGGYDIWARLPQGDLPHFIGKPEKSTSRVARAFDHWCEVYGMKKDGRYRLIAESTPHEPPLGTEPISQHTIAASVGHANVAGRV